MGLVEDSRRQIQKQGRASECHPSIAIYPFGRKFESGRHTVASLFQFRHFLDCFTTDFHFRLSTAILFQRPWALAKRNIGPAPGYLHQLASHRRGCQRSLEDLEMAAPIPIPACLFRSLNRPTTISHLCSLCRAQTGSPTG